MRKEMISELCRFYQGEEKCPFEGDALKLWDIERIYFEALRDADKLSLAIASSFNAEVIDAIGRYYPSEKDELIARYNGSLREIIVSVGSGWAEAEKDAQNRLSAIRGKIASMPRDAARSFLIDEIKDHSDFSDSLLGQSYENSGAWVTFDKPSWVLRETIEYHYWRIQDAMDRYFGQDQSDIIKNEVSRFLIHILMRDGLREVYSEVIQGKKLKSPRVSGIDGEAASVKTELKVQIDEFLKDPRVQDGFIKATHHKKWMEKGSDIYKWYGTNGNGQIGELAWFFGLLFEKVSRDNLKITSKGGVNWEICRSLFGDMGEYIKSFSDLKGKDGRGVLSLKYKRIRDFINAL